MVLLAWCLVRVQTTQKKHAALPCSRHLQDAARHPAPQLMWDELGTARFAPVNMYSGGPRGIVYGP
jgi:hypothetical protein